MSGSSFWVYGVGYPLALFDDAIKRTRQKKWIDLSKVSEIRTLESLTVFFARLILSKSQLKHQEINQAIFSQIIGQKIGTKHKNLRLELLALPQIVAWLRIRTNMGAWATYFSFFRLFNLIYKRLLLDCELCDLLWLTSKENVWVIRKRILTVGKTTLDLRISLSYLLFKIN